MMEKGKAGDFLAKSKKFKTKSYTHVYPQLWIMNKSFHYPALTPFSLLFLCRGFRFKCWVAVFVYPCFLRKSTPRKVILPQEKPLTRPCLWINHK
jgi:hypothetical protein